MAKLLEVETSVLLEAIKNSGAIISTIAKRLGVTWNTAERIINSNPEALQAYNDEEQTILDAAESTIYNSIKSGDIQAAKWVLSTKGRRRGWGEKLEIDGKMNVTIIDDV